MTKIKFVDVRHREEMFTRPFSAGLPQVYDEIETFFYKTIALPYAFSLINFSLQMQSL